MVNLDKIIKRNIVKILEEASSRNKDRSTYVGDENLKYSLDNYKDFTTFFTQGKDKGIIKPGGFVAFSYISEVKSLNKTVSNDVTENGEQLKEEIFNTFNPEIANQLVGLIDEKIANATTSKRGSSRTFLVFNLKTRQIHWGSKEYSDRLNKIDTAFSDSMQNHIDDIYAYIKSDRFQKQAKAYVDYMRNDENINDEEIEALQDEINTLVASPSQVKEQEFNDLFNKIRKTNLTQGYNLGKPNLANNRLYKTYRPKDKDEDEHYLQVIRQNELKNFPTLYYMYYEVGNEQKLYRLRKSEVNLLFNIFKTNTTIKNDEEFARTELKQMLDKIDNEYPVRNYKLSSIARFAFTDTIGNSVTYINHGFTLSYGTKKNPKNITIDCSKLFNNNQKPIPAIEDITDKTSNTNNYELNRVNLSEKILRQIIKNSVKRALNEAIVPTALFNKIEKSLADEDIYNASIQRYNSNQNEIIIQIPKNERVDLETIKDVLFEYDFEFVDMVEYKSYISMIFQS